MKKSDIGLIFLVVLLLGVSYAYAAIDAVSLQAPLNNSYTNNSQPSFVFNVSGNITTGYNCTLLINSTVYGINESVDNLTSTTIAANSALAGAVHNWTVNCSDADGSLQSNVRFFTLDTVVPNATLAVYTDVVLSEVDDSALWHANFTYDAAMNQSISPDVSFAPAVSALASCVGEWKSSTIYRYNCTISDTDIEILDVNVTLSNATDLAGNTRLVQDLSAQFDVDMVKPGIAVPTLAPSYTLNATVIYVGTSVNITAAVSDLG